MINVTLSSNFDGILSELKKIDLNIKNESTEFLLDAAKIVEKNTLKELRSPLKTGTIKPKYRKKFSTSFSTRRSAKGESLASDTGHLESLLNSDKISPNQSVVGFFENKNGYDYASFHEKKNHRPTLEKALNNSIKEIESLFDRKLKPR